MIGEIYWASLVVVSIAAPLLASRIPLVKWRYKLPLCLLLANVLPVMAVAPLFPNSRAVAGLGIAMMFGLIVSTLIALPLSVWLQERAAR